jgi:oligopeptidase A
MEPAVTKFASNFVNDLKKLESILGRKSVSGEKIKCDDLLFPIEMHSDPLERTWGIVTHLMSVQNSDNLRKVHDKLQPLVIKTFMESAQSKTLYNSYLHLRNGDEWEKLSVEQQVSTNTAHRTFCTHLIRYSGLLI